MRGFKAWNIFELDDSDVESRDRTIVYCSRRKRLCSRRKPLLAP